MLPWLQITSVFWDGWTDSDLSLWLGLNILGEGMAAIVSELLSVSLKIFSFYIVQFENKRYFQTICKEVIRFGTGSGLAPGLF